MDGAQQPEIIPAAAQHEEEEAKLILPEMLLRAPGEEANIEVWPEPPPHEEVREGEQAYYVDRPIP